MRAGSITKGAQALGISQPAVSRALRQMEASTGLTLFRRMHGRVSPSPEAEFLYPEVNRVFADLACVGNLASQLRDGQAGRLNVAALSVLATTFVPAVVERLICSRPRATVQLQGLPSAQIVHLVTHQEVDVGFLHAPVQDSRVRSEEICETEIVCILPLGHPLESRECVEVRDLQRQPIISFGPDTSVGTLLEGAFADARVPLELTVVANQTVTAYALVQAGVGVALVDPFVLYGGNATGVAVRRFRPAIKLRPRLINSLERPVSRLAREFSEALRAVCAERAGDPVFPLRLL